MSSRIMAFSVATSSGSAVSSLSGVDVGASGRVGDGLRVELERSVFI